MGKLLIAAACAATLLAAAPAHAVVYVEGTGEPAFTNTTTNTQWVRWQGSPSYSTYKVEFDYYANNAFNSMQATGALAPNGAGTLWANWSGIATTLQEGSTYGICAYGRYTIDGYGTRDTGSCFDADSNGKRAATTIDRTKPAIAVSIDSGAVWSRTANLHYRINYSDNLAFPFPANFLCRDVGTAPAQACADAPVAYNEACSVPAGGMKKTTWFDCSENLAAANVADGPVTLCAVAADAAIPDNPNNANQSASATQANLSTRSCDSITIDRTPPSVAVGTSATTVMVGDLVSFAAQASDATSGLAGAYAWVWGDNTSAGTGATASHTYTAPGTYEVALTTADGAGNETTAKKVVTVKPRPADAPAPAPGGGSGGSGTPPAPGTGTGSGTPPAQAPGDDPADDEGDDEDDETLTVAAARQVRLGSRTRTLPVRLTATGPGLAKVVLVRAGRRHAEGATVLRTGSVTYRLKLPRGLRAGTYVLKVTWTPARGDESSTQTRGVRFVAATQRRARALASAASKAPRVAERGAPVGVPSGQRPDAPADREVDLPVG